MPDFYIPLFTIGVLIFGCVLLFVGANRAVLAVLAAFMVFMIYWPIVYFYFETQDIYGAVFEGSIYTFVLLVVVGVAISLNKLVELAEAKARKCSSCCKPRLVWPDCYTCVNPDCERFVAGLVDLDHGT